MILLNYMGIPGTFLSLFLQFIRRPQEVKLSPLYPEGITYCLTVHLNLNLLKHLSVFLVKTFGNAMQPVDISIFWKMWACTWQIRKGSTVTNITLFESIYVINSRTVGQLFFF